MDLGELIPIMGIAMLAGTTALSIAGAYVLGRSRRRDDRQAKADPELTDRVARVEHLLETMALEIERVGEGQRFLIKVMADKQLSSAPETARSAGRVITPH